MSRMCASQARKLVLEAEKMLRKQFSEFQAAFEC